MHLYYLRTNQNEHIKYFWCSETILRRDYVILQQINRPVVSWTED